VDKISKEQRSRNMSSIGHKDTQPELLVRKFLHGKGYRYRLHHKKLPGRPDIVLSKFKTCLFVNGCFWHRPLDERCGNCRLPKSNTAFWKKKFEENIQRDAKNLAKLHSMGWKTISIWECDLTEKDILKKLEESLLD